MQVQSLLEPELLVVSEAYPPNAIGGAETSLHIVLQRLAQRMRLVVLSFHDSCLPGVQLVDGVNVIFMPKRVISADALADSFMVAIRHLHLLLGFDIPHNAPNSEPVDVVRVRSARHITDLQMDVNRDYESVARSYALACVHEVIRLLNPYRIHADNYRAAVLCGQVRPFFKGFLSVMIRDNRFACVRSNNSLMVRQRTCTACDFSCASEQCPSDPAGQKMVFERIQQYRISTLRSFDTVMVTGPHLQQVMSGFTGIQTTIVSNPAGDVAAVNRIIQPVAQSSDLSVLVIGMLNENKGQHSFIKQYLAELKVRSHPFVTFHFAGRGERIRKQIETLLTNETRFRVVFHDFLGREDLFRLIRASHVVACPTVWPEPFGRVPLEAGLCGRPVVAFGVGGLVSSIRNGKTGYLVKPGDYTKFFALQRELLLHPERAIAMGTAARSFITESYSVELACDAFERALQSAHLSKENRCLA